MKLRRLEKLAIWADVTYALCCGCATKHSVAISSESKLSEIEHTQAGGQEHVGPWTETVWEFAPGPPSPDGAGPRREGDYTHSAGSTAPLSPGTAVGRSDTGTLPDPGQLVKVTVRDHQGRDTSWQASSDGTRGAETRVAVTTEDKSQPSTGCALGLGFGGVLAVAGLLLAGALYLRMRP